ncbi:MAG: hypothetical protein FWC64_08905 [Treponema sp.]|nr:hypothetical protein [Treponema sp.]
MSAGNPNLTNGIGWWNNRTVLRGPGFTAALVQRFPLRDFVSNQPGAGGARSIADTHMINEQGVLVLLP